MPRKGAAPKRSVHVSLGGVPRILDLVRDTLGATSAAEPPSSHVVLTRQRQSAMKPSIYEIDCLIHQ
jgi:hypothetical protein